MIHFMIHICNLQWIQGTWYQFTTVYLYWDGQ